jgi:troponin T
VERLLTGLLQPKIQVASKYERRVDTRSYDDKKKLFEGGYEDIIKEVNEKLWKDKFGQFDSRQKCKNINVSNACYLALLRGLKSGVNL